MSDISHFDGTPPDDEHGNRDSSEVEAIGEILKRMPDISPPADARADRQAEPDRG